jgi:hypothetical protein
VSVGCVFPVTAGGLQLIGPVMGLFAARPSGWPRCFPPGNA